jgi:hypothetical protein
MSAIDDDGTLSLTFDFFLSNMAMLQPSLVFPDSGYRPEKFPKISHHVDSPASGLPGGTSTRGATVPAPVEADCPPTPIE